MPFDPTPASVPALPATVPTERLHIFIDTEYRDDGRSPVVLCALIKDQRYTFDLRDGDYQPLQRFVADNIAREATWFAFAALAELKMLLTCGCDIRALRMIDLYAESRQITSSHSIYRFTKKSEGSLLDTLARFGITGRGSPAWKEQMRDAILENTTYPAALWTEIVWSCFSDIEPLVELWEAITAVYEQANCVFGEPVAVFRGDYLKATARLEHRSQGFPVNVPLLERLYENRRLVTRTLAEQAVAQYGPVYLITQRDVRFNFAGLRKNIIAQPEPIEWQLTPSGRPKMDSEFLSQLVAKYPYYKTLKSTYEMLNHFCKKDLRPLLQDGYIPVVSVPYHTSTGRNQGYVSRGYILNMRPWLRSLMRPPEGYLVVSGDWSQQEICLSCAMSGDRRLKAALESGDCYLALAKLAGAVPPDATTASHPVQRQLYKSVQLGIGYGMQEGTLGLTIYTDLRDQALRLNLPAPDLDDCMRQAWMLLHWHRTTFATFWRWSEQVVSEARRLGYSRSYDGWTTFADMNSRATRLANFPVQSNAAAVLRQATRLLANHDEITFITSHHDALYILCREADEIEHTNTLVRCMTRATEQVMARTPMPMPIRVDIKRYTHAQGYYDARDTKTLPALLSILESHGV